MNFREYCNKKECSYENNGKFNAELKNYGEQEATEKFDRLNNEYKNMSNTELKEALFDFVREYKAGGKDVNGELDYIYNMLKAFLPNEQLENIENLIEELKNDNNQTWCKYRWR